MPRDLHPGWTHPISGGIPSANAKGHDPNQGVPLILSPISFPDACAFISLHHRHHTPPRGWKFGSSVLLGSILCGVVICGRPVSRILAADPYTLEITRCCTDGTPHAASKLYAAARRAAFALGYTRIITYTLISEHGSSLLAAAFRIHSYTYGKSWNTPARSRSSPNPTDDKILWESLAHTHL